MTDLPAAVLAGRFVKTDAGRAEVQRRTVALSRAARNLLLIIDASRSGDGWLAMVQSAAPADLLALQSAGLITAAPAGSSGTAKAAAAAAPTPLARPPAPPAPLAPPVAPAPAATQAAPRAAPASAGPAPATPRMSLAQALETKAYATLYDRITAEARPRLGLIKGYKLILEVERCSGPDEIRALAQRFVEQVRQVQGDAAALALAQTLLAPG